MTIKMYDIGNRQMIINVGLLTNESLTNSKLDFADRLHHIVVYSLRGFISGWIGG